MLDPKLLRNELETTAERLAIKGYTLDQTLFNQLEEQRKKLQVETQELQQQRNQKSKEIGMAKGRGEDIEPLKKAIDQLGSDLKEKEQALQLVQTQLNDI